MTRWRSTLRSADRELVKRAAGSKTTVLGEAIARLYVSHPGGTQWRYTGISGCLVLTFDRISKSNFLKIIDVSTEARGVLWDQEIYSGLQYNQDRTFFHSFEIEDCFIGLSFCNEREAESFRGKVLKISPYFSSNNPFRQARLAQRPVLKLQTQSQPAGPSVPQPSYTGSVEADAQDNDNDPESPTWQIAPALPEGSRQPPPPPPLPPARRTPAKQMKADLNECITNPFSKNWKPPVPPPPRKVHLDLSITHAPPPSRPAPPPPPTTFRFTQPTAPISPPEPISQIPIVIPGCQVCKKSNPIFLNTYNEAPPPPHAPPPPPPYTKYTSQDTDAEAGSSSSPRTNLLVEIRAGTTLKPVGAPPSPPPQFLPKPLLHIPEDTESKPTTSPSRADLLDSIRAGTTLKHVRIVRLSQRLPAPPPPPPPPPPPQSSEQVARNSLLASIRTGTTLKPVKLSSYYDLPPPPPPPPPPSFLGHPPPYTESESATASSPRNNLLLDIRAGTSLKHVNPPRDHNYMADIGCGPVANANPPHGDGLLHALTTALGGRRVTGYMDSDDEGDDW